MADSGAAGASLEEIHRLFQDAVADAPSLSLLRGFKVDFSGNRDFHKIYLAAPLRLRDGCPAQRRGRYGQDLAGS